jgi:LmbE family N-acetylglucosaminyl deacetylase
MATPTLLLSFAHPDDESVSAAGTIARYTRDGVCRVVLLSATRGGAATHGVDVAGSREALPAVRDRELRDAARILRVDDADVHLLDHPDGGLAGVDPLRIRRELVALIRATRPDVVLTFDPNGTNLHPDHVAISRFTIDAIAAAADPRWFPDAGAAHTVPRVLWTPPVSVWTMIREVPPAEDLFAAIAARPGVDYLIDTRDSWRQKQAALLAHRTQKAAIEKRMFLMDDDERAMSAEAFRHGGGIPPRTRPARSLFDDLSGL